MRIITYNVHVWYDNDGRFKLPEMIDLIKELKPDILCLQEITKHGLSEFVKETGFTKVFKYHSVAILTNIENVEELSLPSNTRNFYPRFATIKVPLEGGREFFLTCVHLDYKVESSRMKEIIQIKKHLKCLNADAAQVWAGDFNALTLEDYSESVLNEVTSVRRKNQWEPPKNDVSNAMKSDGFECSWALVNRPPPLATCRFDTHIDYIYINKEFRKIFQVTKVEHHGSKASDHSPVIADFQFIQAYDTENVSGDQ